MQSRVRKRCHWGLSGLAFMVCLGVLAGLSCGGGGGSSNTVGSDPPATNLYNPPASTPTQLTAQDVTTIVNNALASVNAPMVVAVVDRGGNILAVYKADAAPLMSMNLGKMVYSDDLAVGLARTAAYFSNDAAPLSSRTVRFISGIHFPPGVANTPNADLYGIENTNRGCTLSADFLPGQMLNPSGSIHSGQFGTGIVTGKVDTNDDLLPDGSVAVNPGGVPLYNPVINGALTTAVNGVTVGGVVGGVGVVSTTPEISEYAAAYASLASGFLPSPTALPTPGVVIVGGISLPFVDQLSQPAGTTPGPYTGSGMYEIMPANSGVPTPSGYLVGPNAGSMLAAGDVDEIIQNAVTTAQMTRAVIRLPSNSSARMTIAVSDLDGTLLGLYRMEDGTIFSTDVAASKARNVIWASTFGVADLSGVPTGTAVTNRTISFGAMPLFPPGINGTNPGPFFPLYEYDTANPCTQGPSSSAFPPNTNNMSGIVFFPGSLPLYRNGVLVGGLGVSGDGVDQDDFVTASAVDAACGAGGPCGIPDFQAPVNIRADQVVIDNVRLPYQKFPRNPTE